MRSRLYAGVVQHRRTEPAPYRFRYGLFYTGIDLDEIETLDRRLRLFSYNRFNVMSLRDRDHKAGENGLGIREAIRRHLAEQGVNLGGGSVLLLTYPRVLGYIFNPVSFYICSDAAGAMRHVIAEVHNTHGERHCYDLWRVDDARADAYVARADKAFYVSPFIDMDARYEFLLRQREGGFHVRIDEYRGDAPFFQAEIHVSPRPFTDAQAARLLLRFPFVTLKTIGLIYWNGLKLWLRRVPFHRHGAQTRRGDTQEAKP